MSQQIMYDGRWIPRDSELGKEIAKFEKPYVYVHYPLMMYRAARNPKGKVKVHEDAIDFAQTVWKDADLAKEQDRIAFFNRSNERVVNSDAERTNAMNEGWRETPQGALAFFESREREIGNLAAERAFKDAKMSEKAQEEAAVVDAATEFHLPEIPEAPVKRRGRPRKDA